MLVTPGWLKSRSMVMVSATVSTVPYPARLTPMAWASTRADAWAISPASVRSRMASFSSNRAA